jgi:hypothetical protein
VSATRPAKSLPVTRANLSYKFFFSGQPLHKNSASHLTFERLFVSDGLGSLRVGLTVALSRICGNSHDPKS